MVELFRTKSHVILCYEALFRELKPKYKNNRILQDNYSNFLAGHRGEKSADYLLSIFPQKSSMIYQGIRLTLPSIGFQIDTLVTSRGVIIILEIKNMKDELEYDSKSHQFTQTNGDKKKGYKSPVLQAETQKMNLKRWLHSHGFPPIPIVTLAIVSNPSAILVNNQDDPIIYDKLIHLETLPKKLEQIYKKYNETIYDYKTLKLLNQKLLQGNTPKKVDLLTQFNITDKYLIKGIACSSCNHYPLIRKRRNWLCPRCKSEDMKAHERKILDYFLLHKETITNQECRDLLQITSTKTAYLLLKSMNLKYTGDNSGRKYISPLLHEFPQELASKNFSKRSIFENDI